MLKRRRTRLLGGTGALLLVLSLSGVAAGVTPPDAEPDPTIVDTTASYEDIDGNGIDDDCQDVAAEDNPDAVAAELLTVDTDADGVISTTEAAHSPRIGGNNCNHGGYVSWIAHQKHDCVVEPTVEPTVVLVVTTPPDAEPDAVACEPEVSDAAITAAKKDKVAAKAAREASKAERTLAREAAKAERTLAHEASKAERTLAREAAKAERQAAKAARQAAHQAKHKGH